MLQHGEYVSIYILLGIVILYAIWCKVTLSSCKELLLTDKLISETLEKNNAHRAKIRENMEKENEKA